MILFPICIQSFSNGVIQWAQQSRRYRLFYEIQWQYAHKTQELLISSGIEYETQRRRLLFRHKHHTIPMFKWFHRCHQCHIARRLQVKVWLSPECPSTRTIHPASKYIWKPPALHLRYYLWPLDSLNTYILDTNHIKGNSLLLFSSVNSPLSLSKKKKKKKLSGSKSRLWEEWSDQNKIMNYKYVQKSWKSDARNLLACCSFRNTKWTVGGLPQTLRLL